MQDSEAPVNQSRNTNDDELLMENASEADNTAATSTTQFYLPPSAIVLPSPTDDDLVPSSSELRAAFASQTKARSKLIGGPLLTAKLRAKQEVPKKVWEKCMIRARFGDRSVIQHEFTSDKKMADVYNWVQSCLQPDLGTWTLSQSPPRIEYSRTNPQTLSELSFGPMSALLITFEDKALNSGAAPVRQTIQEIAKELPKVMPQPGAEGDSVSAEKPKKKNSLPAWLTKNLKK